MKVNENGFLLCPLCGKKTNTNAVVLENLIVGDFLQEVEDHAFEMSPDEYTSFQELLQKGKESKASFLTSLRQHLSSFAVGVVANVLSAYISKGL